MEKQSLWTCDECGDLLNNQARFTDRQEEWECKKCGFVNHIVPEEIFETNGDYLDYKIKSAQPYVCSQCGAVTHGPKCEYCGVTLENFRR